MSNKRRSFIRRLVLRVRAWVRLTLSRPWRVALFFIALIPILGFGYLSNRVLDVIDRRIKVFHELEMYEGDMTLAAIRLLEGKEMYPDANSDFIPLLYTPMYTYLHSWAMRIIDEADVREEWKETAEKNDEPIKNVRRRAIRSGPPIYTIYSGRLISMAGTWLCVFVIFGWIYQETKSLLAALCAAGYFLGINHYIGWWFDLARVDMVFMAFVALGTWLLLCRKSDSDFAEAMKGVIGGLIFVLGFFTKQTAGPLAILTTMLALSISPMRAIWAATAGLTFGFAGQLYLNAINTDFWYLTVEVPSNHINIGGTWENRLRALTEQIFIPAAIPLTVIGVWSLVMAYRRHFRILLILPAGAVASYMSVRGLFTMGGYINHYLPMWFFIVLTFGMAVGSFMPTGGARMWSKAVRAIFALVILAGALVVTAHFFNKSLDTPFESILNSDLLSRLLLDRIWKFEPALWIGIGALVLYKGLSARPGPRTHLRRAHRLGLAPVIILTAACLALFHYSKAAPNPQWNPLGAYEAAESKWKFWDWMPDVAERLADFPEYEQFDREYKVIKDEALPHSRAFIETVKRIDGNIWIPHHNFYAYLAGRPTEISTDHVRDVTVAGRPINPYVLNIINKRKYKYILLNNVTIEHDWQDPQVHHALRANYVFVENWDQKLNHLALRSVDSTAQKPRALFVSKDALP